MHRDLKLANIFVNFPDRDFGTPPPDMDRMAFLNQHLKKINLLEERIEIKIGDLGFAKEVDIEDVTKTQCGTPLSMAPEVLKGRYYNHKADVWSLGVVSFELLAGFTPFTGTSKEDL